jgi:uncharacterized membrane protein
MKLGNLNEWFLRIPSVIFGVVTIFLVYKVANEFFNKKVALLSSSLLATSQFHIYYSQELRMYSLLCLLTTLSMWFYYRKNWIFFILTGLLGLYTSYMFVLIFIPQFIWLISRRLKILRQYFISLIFIATLFIPWLPTFLKQLESSKNLLLNLSGWQKLLSQPVWMLIPQLFLKFSLGRINFDNKFLYGVIFGMLVLLYGYILRNLRKNPSDKMIFVLNWLISPLIVGILISFFIPISGVWRLIFLLPPFLILVSVATLKTRHSSIVILCLLCINLLANFLYFINPKYQRENWKDAVDFLENDERPIVFVVEDGFAPYQWYKGQDKLICGYNSLESCLKYNKLYFVSYLEDLFDKNRLVTSRIENRKFTVKKINDFPGVGFIYDYQKL